MKKILILTVGGSHQPLLTSIEKIKPDKVFFLCSQESRNQVIGEGKVLKSSNQVLKSSNELKENDLPNIVTLAGLNDGQYEIEQIDEIDDLSSCYRVCYELIQKLHNENPDYRIIVDYTGGTKSMSAGLVASALDDEKCEIRIVTGKREDLIKVANGTQVVFPVEIRKIQLERGIKRAKALVERFDYSGAENIITSLAEQYAAETETREYLNKLATICRAFDSWDRFDHKTALLLLEHYASEFSNYVIFLKFLTGNRAYGYEKVEDLLLNAERRATQCRYDDAVARLYRAIEMLAQVRLEKLGINTSNVDLSKIKDRDLAGELEKTKDDNGKVKIGLAKAWELLSTEDNGPLPAHYKSCKGKIIDFLKHRNNSILAHGTEPISEAIYKEHAKFIADFITKGIDEILEYELRGKKSRMKLFQFPNDFIK